MARESQKGIIIGHKGRALKKVHWQGEIWKLFPEKDIFGFVCQGQ